MECLSEFFSDEIEVQSGHEISISAMHYQAAEDLMGDGSTFNYLSNISIQTGI